MSASSPNSRNSNPARYPPSMKVFISSVIGGFELYRDAAATAVETLGYEVVRAEDFGATVSSPQEACLAGVREVDLTILLLGERYGAEQPSGLSATHEEYREAQGRQPVLAFVQEGVDHETRQTEFIREVREWETGTLTSSFRTEVDLRGAVTRGLHLFAVSVASGSIDERELLAIAEGGVDDSTASKFFGGEPEVVLSLAPGPRREILRPSELEDDSLARELQQEVLFGTHSLFAVESGASTELRGERLVVSQDRASVEITSAGDIVVRQAAMAADRSFTEIPALEAAPVRPRQPGRLQRCPPLSIVGARCARRTRDTACRAQPRPSLQLAGGDGRIPRRGRCHLDPGVAREHTAALPEHACVPRSRRDAAPGAAAGHQPLPRVEFDPARQRGP
ncbi:MAG: DUF4062 domain-containing protein [Dehalococcoidia bacterium]|nr:DUF4062 domain-containing protein [Dehalococcoidia bacterium]MYA53014.1 DUF4062 domain-containing protein [Dehalococcoidia bacterium]